MIYHEKNRIANLLIVFIFFSLIVFQFNLFKIYVYHEIISYYPHNHDQSVYLPLTYEVYEQIRHHFSMQSLAQLLTLLPTGVFFPINALLSYFIIEPSRFAALIPNFIYFILLQIISFSTIKKLSGKYYLAFILLGLILTINTPFATAGGIDDFRMDFIAFCLYGIFINIVIQSKIFFSKKWTILAAIIAAFTIFMRSLTIVYFLLMAMTLIIYFILKYFNSTNSDKISRIHFKIRMMNLCLWGVIISALVLPFFLLNQNSLYQYYVVGHLTGPEGQIRGLPAGTNFFDQLIFYPQMLFKYHISQSFEYAFMLLVLMNIGFYIFLKLKQRTFLFLENDFSIKMDLYFLFISIISPLAILTYDPSKSYVVCGIVMMPLLWIMSFCIFSINKKLLRFFPNTAWILNGLAGVIMMIGIIHQFHAYLGWKHKKDFIDDRPVITKMCIDIGDYALIHHWDHIRISTDQITDFINSGNIKTLYYEIKKKLLNISSESMGNSIFSITKKEAFASLLRSNVIVLTTENYPTTNAFPFNQSILPLRSELIRYADQHFALLGDYRYGGGRYRVYTNSNSTI